MNSAQRSSAKKALGLLLVAFGETFSEIDFMPQIKPNGDIVWSYDVSIEPDWEERLSGWLDMLEKLRPQLYELGYDMQVQEDGEFFGGYLKMDPDFP